VEKKINNPKFLEKAPNNVVEKERQKLHEFQTNLAKLEDQLKRIKSL